MACLVLVALLVALLVAGAAPVVATLPGTTFVANITVGDRMVSGAFAGNGDARGYAQTFPAAVP